jgi:hypothetical protein
MHIDGEELLYVLNQSGAIVSKAWGGTGNLTVEGTLSVNGGQTFSYSGIGSYGTYYGSYLTNSYGNSLTIAPYYGYGIYARGDTMGGYFYDYDEGEYTYISYGRYSLYGTGKVRARADNGYSIVLGGDSAGSDVEIGSEHSAMDRIAFWNSGGSYRMDIYPRWVYESSSVRWKKEIETIGGALDKVMKLRGVYYKWKPGSPGYSEEQKGRQLGMIAEEVYDVIPEIVKLDDDGSGFATDLAYDRVAPLLVEALKEQQGIIEALEARIEALESKLR